MRATRKGAVQVEPVVSLHDRVEQLFREARTDVYYYILSFGLASQEAQEIAQDVFLRFYLALKRGETIENARGWIFRVAHNLAVNAVERQATRRAFAAGPRPALSPDDPEQRLIRKQAAEKLQQAFSALSPQQRLCLQLRAEGLKYGEIARLVGVGTSTVGEFLSRAIGKLRKSIHE